MHSSTFALGASLLMAALTASAPLISNSPAPPKGENTEEKTPPLTLVPVPVPAVPVPEVAACPPLIILFARGTSETGELGTDVGPYLEAKVAAELGDKASFTIRGVPPSVYPASIPGFLVGGSPRGSRAMAKMAIKAVKSCPASKVVLSGFSQGAQVVHNACKQLPASVSSKLSVSLFGDPDFGEKLIGVPPGGTNVFCHPDDNICAHGYFVLPSHTTYGPLDSGAAAKFIVTGVPVTGVIQAAAKNNAEGSSSSLAKDLYAASADIPDTELSSADPQRLPDLARVAEPPAGTLFSLLPNSTASSPTKRRIFGGPQDVPSLFNFPVNPLTALAPVKE